MTNEGTHGNDLNGKHPGGSPMDRLRALMRQTEFHVLLFSICLFLFGWPLATIADLDRLEGMFVYLFVTWAIVIVLLFFVGRSQISTDGPEKR
jgi:hypothetical protein